MAKSNLLCPRSAAALVIQRVKQGQSLNTAFVDISKRLDETQRPLFQQLTYGVIRWFFALESISELEQTMGKRLNQCLSAKLSTPAGYIGKKPG